MVSERYLLRRPRPHGAARLFLDQRLIPAAIDMAAAVEAGAERMSQRVEAQPIATLTVCFGTAFLLAGLMPRRRRR